MKTRFIFETVEITDVDTDESRRAEVITDVNETYTYERLSDIVGLLNQLHQENQILETDCKNQKESKEYWRNKVKELEEENEQLRRLFEEMKQPITINLTEEDEKELRKLLGLIDDE